ncbi:hypothetical protein SAMN02745246_00432 [Leeuwenhoekiella marinoflava DSM 3653]|uniref:Uncharacterized protein n=2 Tax=Leeuwenhoekiella marinoflava TaxID=988 RepID=A0A4Q0PRR2_9FLAO|nr:hypothetical protein DSL99_373 [Leeuwenhoekiella marinoflava]SHE45335.1 hypothetical protein SAMN02745246_00432 [Leeuwenhoekiella marinoflava DSM 3653]
MIYKLNRYVETGWRTNDLINTLKMNLYNYLNLRLITLKMILKVYL